MGLPNRTEKQRLARSGGLAALAVLCAIVICAIPARAQESLTPPEQQVRDLIDLAGTYQSCYFNMVAVSCFQLYSSTGVIATDYARGYIDAETALTALEQNSLLLTTSLTTLERVHGITPDDDHEILDEIARLGEILIAENELVTALTEVCLSPSDRSEAQVEAARLNVEELLDDYVGEPTEN